MKILFVAGVAPIVPDLAEARALYVDAIGLPLSDDEYPATFELDGVKHFGLWPLSEAAQACFGNPDWPADITVPQASIEFEVEGVEDVAGAAVELEGRGYRLLHGARVEPWGQTVARLLGPEGLVVGLSYAPWYHESPGGKTAVS
jgi:catechol 2,3-dioxygenase-like lactoylglutathione lyase family enzyme